MDTEFSMQTGQLEGIYSAMAQESCHIVCKTPVWIDQLGNPIALSQIEPADKWWFKHKIYLPRWTGKRGIDSSDNC